MTPEKFGNPPQEKKEYLRAKMQQLQKEQHPKPCKSVLHGVPPSPVSPPTDSAGELVSVDTAV